MKEWAFLLSPLSLLKVGSPVSFQAGLFLCFTLDGTYWDSFLKSVLGHQDGGVNQGQRTSELLGKYKLSNISPEMFCNCLGSFSLFVICLLICKERCIKKKKTHTVHCINHWKDTRSRIRSYWWKKHKPDPGTGNIREKGDSMTNSKKWSGPKVTSCLWPLLDPAEEPVWGNADREECRTVLT